MKKIKFYAISLASFFVVAGCSDSVDMKSEVPIETQTKKMENQPKVKDLLTNAKSSKSIAFMVVESKNKSGDKSKKIINEIIKDITNSVLISMDIDDKENEKMIKEYSLANAPIPLVLIFASNGSIVGGI